MQRAKLKKENDMFTVLLAISLCFELVQLFKMKTVCWLEGVCKNNTYKKFDNEYLWSVVYKVFVVFAFNICYYVLIVWMIIKGSYFTPIGFGILLFTLLNFHYKKMWFKYLNSACCSIGLLYCLLKIIYQI